MLKFILVAVNFCIDVLLKKFKIQLLPWKKACAKVFNRIIPIPITSLRHFGPSARTYFAAEIDFGDPTTVTRRFLVPGEYWPFLDIWMRAPLNCWMSTMHFP